MRKAKVAHTHECSVREDTVCEPRGYCKCACGYVREWDAGGPVPAEKDGGEWITGEGR
jgi:hypothetical protein